ncbi:hypothetical protein D3C78_1399690 [compost metagenome]
MRFFIGNFGQHADLVEVRFDEAFLGKRVQCFAHGGIVVRRPQNDVDVDAFGIVVLIGLADDDEDHRLFASVVVVGEGAHDAVP